MSTMYNLLHIPLCTVMLILIFNSTAYCYAHSFTFYILFFISYFSFILSYVYFPCVVFSIFALSMERTRLSFHCWLYNLCIVVYVTNKTWNLKTWKTIISLMLLYCCTHYFIIIHFTTTCTILFNITYHFYYIFTVHCISAYYFTTAVFQWEWAVFWPEAQEKLKCWG